MSGAQLQAWLTQNKTAVLGVAGAGVVGVALLQRKRAGGDVSSSGAGAGVGPSSPAGYSAGGQTAGGAYDSTASDLYGAMSPELAGIAEKLAKIEQGQEKGNSTPIPVPEAPAPPPPVASVTAGVKPGFYKKGAESNIYQVNANGTLDYLTRAEFGAITKGQKTKPKVQAVSSDHAMWGSGGHWLDKHKQKAPVPVAAPAK